jgi:TonB-linked SusC/RagA family outer membrane protein
MRKILLIIIVSVGLNSLFAQTGTVTGTVTGAEDGLPLAGASVSIKGTSAGVTTNSEGKYSLDVPANATLVFSFLGTVTQEIAAGNRSVIDVVLEAAAESMEGIVVTAMGISRGKNSIGYATQEVKAEKLTITPQTDLNNALAGKIAGVRMWGASGATFDAGRIVIRGTSTLSPSGQDPIYVVDGVITNVNVVNMDDVESINVLKGPAATALYGSRGGNGAVIITSKRKSNSPSRNSTVEFKQSIGFEKVVPYIDYQNEYGGGSLGMDDGNAELPVYHYNAATDPEYLRALDGVRYYDYGYDVSWGPRFDGEPYAPWYAWDPTHPKFGQTAPWSGQPGDNLKELFKTGFLSNTSVAFTKTVGDFSTRISIGNQSRTGVTENSKAVRRYLSVDAQYKVTDRLKIAANYKYTYRNNHNAASDDYGGARDIAYSYTQWFHRNVDISELKNYKRPDGTFYAWNISDITDLEPAYHNNPFALMNEINVDNTLQWNLLNGTVTFDIIKDVLNIGVSGDANIRSEFSDSKYPYYFHGVTPSYSVSQNKLYDIYTKGFVTFNNRFVDDKLDVSARAFVEQRDRDYRAMSGSTVDGLTADRYFNLAASVSQPSVSNSQEALKERSVYGTATVGWDHTYYLDVSLRNDWQSVLPKHNNSYFYGGLSASIIVGNYLKSVEWLDYWKLRASMAQVGSTMGAYNTEQTYVNQSKYNGMTVIRPSTSLRNPNIRPTISTGYEAGTEFRLFGNRLYADINFYRKDSKDQIINLTSTPMSGYSSTQVNAGLIRNSGIEIQLSGFPVKTKDFEWEIYFNWAKNKNELVELDPTDPERTSYFLASMAFSVTAGAYAIVGQPIGVIKTNYDFERYNGKIVYTRQADGSAFGELRQNLRNYSAESDMPVLGNIQPDATGGFGTSFTWRNLRLDVALDYQIGGQIVSATNMFGEGSGLLNSTVGKNDRGANIRDEVWTDRGGIKVEGYIRTSGAAGAPDATYEAVSGYDNAYEYFSRKSLLWSEYTYDCTYLKMREVALTYQLPGKFLKNLRWGISKASFSANIINPWLIYSGIPNIDPSGISHAFSNFVEMGQIFSTRAFGFTLNVTF